MLKDLVVLDLTHRLPGPLAGKILSDLGAQVIKIEDEIHKDPFLEGSFAEFDESFVDWYQELNKKKQIKRFDFKSPTIKEEIKKELAKADGILLSLSPRLKERLGVDEESLRKLKKSFAVVELKASREDKQAMHDLNALASSGFLSLHIADRNEHIVTPPFLPFAGISFGQQVASDWLASYIKATKSQESVFYTSYLYDTVVNNFNPFWSQNLRKKSLNKFLHNGAYPCYSLYQLKDGNYVALAAVEEKFWNDFCQKFSLEIPAAERFSSQETIFKKISDLFAKYEVNEIEAKIKEKDFCLSIVRKV
ncbi:MAG: CoA transferase [Candidatus Caldatribacteriota bacterium]